MTHDSPSSFSCPVVDPHVLDMLVCPVTKGLLRYDAAAQELISDQAGLAFPIRDGIPMITQEQARVMGPYGK